MSEALPELVAELRGEAFRLTFAFDLIAPTWPGIPEWELGCTTGVTASGFSATVFTHSSSVDLKDFVAALASAIVGSQDDVFALPSLGWYGLVEMRISPGSRGSGGVARRKISYRVREYDFGEKELKPPELTGDAWGELDRLGAFRDRLAEIVRFTGP